MNRMKHFISFLLVVALGSFSFKANAYTERNMLQKAADETTLKSVLVMKQAWVPYPGLHRPGRMGLTDGTITSNVLSQQERSFSITSGNLSPLLPILNMNVPVIVK